MPLFSILLKSAIGALLLLAGPVSTPAPNLTGMWIPDMAHSTQSKTLTETVAPGTTPAPPAASQAIQDQIPTMRLTHSEGHLVIEFLEADGSVISTTALTTDGAENVNPRAGGALLHKSRSEWNGAVLRTRWAIEREGRVAISGTEERELLSPTTLRVVTRTQDAKSRSESVILYRRRPAS